jgi:hypothetical protein
LQPSRLSGEVYILERLLEGALSEQYFSDAELIVCIEEVMSVGMAEIQVNQHCSTAGRGEGEREVHAG